MKNITIALVAAAHRDASVSVVVIAGLIAAWVPAKQFPIVPRSASRWF